MKVTLIGSGGVATSIAAALARHDAASLCGDVYKRQDLLIKEDSPSPPHREKRDETD